MGKKKNRGRISSLWDNFNHSKMHIMGFQKEKRKSKKNGNLFGKIMTENFPNLVKELNMQVQETQRVPNKMNAKRPSPRHSIIKMLKVKDKENFKSSKRKEVSHLQENSHKIVN